MPGAIDVDLSQVEKGFRRMLKAGGDLRPVWRLVRQDFRRDQKVHIAEQRGPDSAWPPLAASTREKRLRVGDKKKTFTKKGVLRKAAARKLNRVLSARLVSGAKLRAKPREMSIASKVTWAGIHQEGGVAGRGSRIPARPFMWVSDEFMSVLVPEIEKYLVREWGR